MIAEIKEYQSHEDYLKNGGTITVCPEPGEDDTNPAKPMGDQIVGQPEGNLWIPQRAAQS